MWELLQSYSIWIVLGLLLLFVARVHGHAVKVEAGAAWEDTSTPSGITRAKN